MGLIPFPAQVPWSDLARVKSQEAPPTQTFLQYLSSLDGTVRVIGSLGGSPRIILAAATTFFISPTGSDANSGLTAGTAWATTAPLYARYDTGGQTITLSVAGNLTTNIAISPWVGGGTVILDLFGHSIATTGTDCITITGALPGIVTIQSTGGLAALSCTGANSSCINHLGYGQVNFGNVNFGVAGFTHIEVQTPGAQLVATGNYTINGNPGFAHIQVAPGELRINSASNPGMTVTLTGTPNVGIYIFCSGGQCFMQGETFSGSATGTKYVVINNGVIYTASAGVNYFPGNAAGSFSSGGQYV